MPPLPRLHPLRRPAPALLGGALLLVLLGGCRERRRPLPRAADAGPVVEVIEGPRRGGTAAFAGALVEEHEPDDDREHAQPMEAGKGIRGSVAPPTQEGAGKGDDDWYSYLVQPGEPAGPAGDGARPGTAPAQELRIQLSSATDLALELLDGDGRRLLAVDERPGGEPELISGFSVGTGQTVYLRVRPSGRRARPAKAAAAAAPAPAGKPQVVLVADPSYTLSVTQTSAPQGSEAEPNDTPAQATALSGPEHLLSGVLHSRKDEDWFALDLSSLPNRPAAGAILRIEAQTPGSAPALRVETAAPPSPAPQLGKAPPAARTLLADIKAGGGKGDELRVRNLGLPAGAGVVYVGLRSLGWKPAAQEARYQLRVTVEPPLEDAEQEPNDAPAQATVLLLSRRGGGSEGGLNGFLWPGDVDHYRIPVEGPAQVTVQLSLPQGCAAALSAGPVPSGLPGVPPASPPGRAEGERAQSLTLQVTDVAQIRVSASPTGPGAAGCFEAPYHLTARVELDAAAAPAGRGGAP